MVKEADWEESEDQRKGLIPVPKILVQHVHHGHAQDQEPSSHRVSPVSPRRHKRTRRFTHLPSSNLDLCDPDNSVSSREFFSGPGLPFEISNFKFEISNVSILCVSVPRCLKKKFQPELNPARVLRR